MPFPVLGSNSAVAEFAIDNSLRFNNPDDPNLSKTFSSAGNRRTFTISAWIKKGDTGTDRALIGQGGTSAGNPRGLIFVGSTLRFTSNTTGSFTEADVETNAKLRDHSAWYHLVVAVDTTQGTAANRIKLYINGEQQTSLAIATYPDQNFEMNWNNNVLHTVGRYPNNDAYHMDGHISEFYFIDGTQHTASDFGETNENGVWIPKRFSGSYGTNGFKLEFQDSGNLGDDTSGNGNDFTANNLTATDQTTDTPTNNFCTLNPLDNAVLTLSEGNTKATHSDSGGGEENRATLGAANGKWYFEFQIQHTVGSLNPFAVGMMSNTGRNPLESELKSTEAFTSAWHSDSSTNRIESRVSGSATLLNCNLSYPDNGDIINVAMDLDNGRVYFGKNGTYINDASGNTGNPSTGANPPVSFTTGGHFYFPAIHNRGSQGLTVSLNTGQPSFSISSGNSDANGYGNFEYAVPSGFYALCTKNLAEYG